MKLTQQDAKAQVIWLHGLGASSADLKPMADYLMGKSKVNVYLPDAPMRAVTVNQGYVMPAWYDILAFSPKRQVNEAHIDEICQQIAKIQFDLPIILAGFSQGGAVAYQLISHFANVKGLIAQSTYLLDHVNLPLNPPPCLIQHGDYDDVVHPELGQQALSKYQSVQANTTWQHYPMAHEITLDSMSDMIDWINKVIMEQVN